MKRFFCIVIITITTLLAVSQSEPALLKFDFGDGKTVKGYIPVTPGTLYNDQTGYGFSHGALVQAVKRKGADPLTDDFITGLHPFYFSVKLPDGNYDVKLILGDVQGISATTVRVENRRLMLENIRTGKGETVTKTFTIHKRDSLIRNATWNVVKAVRLKSREINYLHWDNRLTIEFNDSLPKICALEIIPNKHATTVFLAGNSTVVDQGREPWAAWGQMIPRFFVSGQVAVANYAESGETLKAFERERRLEKIWQMAKPGDYLFIEFAHNDQKPGGNHLDPFTTYKTTLMQWIKEARKRQIIPVLVTSMHRRSFNDQGHIINTLETYPEAMRQAAQETSATLIDLNAMSKILYESWGPETSVKAFVHYPAHTFPGQATALKDNTHFSPYGAYELARCVAKALAGSGLELAKYLIAGVKDFDPSHPGTPQQFYWPRSAFTGNEKPDGN